MILAAVLAVCLLVDREVSVRSKLLLVKWRFRYLLDAVGWELLCFPAIALVTFLFGLALDAFGIRIPKPMIIEYLLRCDWISFTLIAVAAVVLAPVTEEIMFRRIIFESLRFRLPVPVAFLATSAAFAAIHLNPLQFPGLLLLGCALQWLYLRRRSLHAPILFHALHNSVAIQILLLLRLAGVDEIPGLELANCPIQVYFPFLFHL